MPSLTRIRRALTLPSRPSSSNTTASSSSTDLPSTPTSTSPSSHNSITELPSMMLTKTTSGLSRIRTGITGNKEEKHRRKVEEWRKRDDLEWERPSKEAKERRSRKWSKEYQDMLRGFEFRCGEPRTSFDGARTGSIFSGISPCTTRVASGAQY